jgi:glutamate racemase
MQVLWQRLQTYFELIQERNTEIFITTASLNYERVTVDFGTEGTYDKEVYEKLNSRIASLDKVKKLPVKKLTGLLEIQNMLTQKGDHLKQYAFDFHRGLQVLQE